MYDLRYNHTSSLVLKLRKRAFLVFECNFPLNLALLIEFYSCQVHSKCQQNVTVILVVYTITEGDFLNFLRALTTN